MSKFRVDARLLLGDGLPPLAAIEADGGGVEPDPGRVAAVTQTLDQRLGQLPAALADAPFLRCAPAPGSDGLASQIDDGLEAIQAVEFIQSQKLIDRSAKALLGALLVAGQDAQGVGFAERLYQLMADEAGCSGDQYPRGVLLCSSGEPRNGSTVLILACFFPIILVLCAGSLRPGHPAES